MTVREENSPANEQRKLSPRERILKRYGINQSIKNNQPRPRTINELYRLRYQSKIR